MKTNAKSKTLNLPATSLTICNPDFWNNYNNSQVLTRCTTELQKFFNINNWQINQPIVLRDISILLDNIAGVTPPAWQLISVIYHPVRLRLPPLQRGGFSSCSKRGSRIKSST